MRQETILPNPFAVCPRSRLICRNIVKQISFFLIEHPISPSVSGKAQRCLRGLDLSDEISSSGSVSFGPCAPKVLGHLTELGSSGRCKPGGSDTQNREVRQLGHAAGSTVPSQCGNCSDVLARKDVKHHVHHIIYAIDVVPRLYRRITACFNDVEGDSVTEVRITTHEDDRIERLL
ncbi:hypothetical protein HG530_014954 [Fusarium avenaceum]|nr:hypothetical protein HG530_014954 [Fusarium avenaceum]